MAVYVNNFDDTSAATAGSAWNSCALIGPDINFTDVAGTFDRMARVDQVSVGGTEQDPDIAVLDTGFSPSFAARDFYVQFSMSYQRYNADDGIIMGSLDGWSLRTENNGYQLAFYNGPEFVMGRSIRETDGSEPPTFWTLTRKDGWLTILADDQINESKAWYPYDILQGVVLIAGTGVATEIAPNTWRDPWQSTLAIDALVMVVGTGYATETGIGPVPTSPPANLPTSTIFINQHPTDTAFSEGFASFSVVATSLDPISYQWYQVPGIELAGETAATLTVNSGNNGDEFYVVLNDGTDTITSETATLFAAPLSPVIDQEPEIAPTFVGMRTYLTVSAFGNNPLTYHWFWTDGTEVLPEGTDSSVYFTPADTSRNGDFVRCLVTENGGSAVYSDWAEVTIGYGISIVPAEIEVAVGDEQLFTLVDNGLNLQTYDFVGWYWADTDEEFHFSQWATPYYTMTVTEENLNRAFYVSVEIPEVGLMPSNTVVLAEAPPPPAGAEDTKREMLVYNWEDDNYTWADAGFDTGLAINGAVCMKYMFDPGWQTRWSDLQDQFDLTGAPTWEDLQNAGTRWRDFYGHGGERNLYMMTGFGLYKTDQVVKTDGIKSYFIRRLQIDCDQLIESWTSNSFKHLRQFYFHAQSDRAAAGTAANTFLFATGWSKNLMDASSWGSQITVNMQATDNSGVHKIDMRTTGRYLSMNIDFSKTLQFKMTGGDMDMEEAHGR